jgi:hypothetical protein
MWRFVMYLFLVLSVVTQGSVGSGGAMMNGEVKNTGKEAVVN